MLYFFSSFLLVLISDQLTKYFALKYIGLGNSIPIIPNIFHLTLLLNKGVAFGLFRNVAYISYILAFLGMALLLYLIVALRNQAIYVKVIYGFILGGAIGNIIDRLRIGAVIDFLDFRIWPVFNLADSFISIAALLLAWKILRDK